MTGGLTDDAGVGARPDGFIRAAAVGDVPNGGLLAVVLPDGGKVCLGQSTLGWFACVDRCPHANYPISEGYLNADGTIECGWHGAKFRCDDGEVCRSPAREGLTMLELRVHDDALWVRRPA